MLLIINLTRKEDTLARLGGDEFILLIDHLSENEDAGILAEKILESLSEPLYINDEEIYISCSIGISLFPNDTQDGQKLLNFADTALYKVKDLGGNNFQYYS